MKLGPVTIFDKKKAAMSKNFDDDVMVTSRDTVIFLIYV